MYNVAMFLQRSFNTEENILFFQEIKKIDSSFKNINV